MSRAAAVGEYPPQASSEDCALFDRVRSEYPSSSAIDFADFSQRCSALDIRTATALLCDLLRRQPKQREFIPEVESPAERFDNSPRPTLLIVPGAFYRHHRHTGADGGRLVTIAQELGWPHERVATPSFGRLERSAAVLLDHLRRSRAESIVLVSLSKGSAEVAHALAQPGTAEVFQRVTGWVSLSGLVFGTPLVDWLRARPLRAAGVHLLLWSRGQRFAVLDQLRRRQPPPGENPPAWPAHLRAIQVLGFPLPEHLNHPWAQRAYDRLAPQGPNDGGGNLLVDALRWPGAVYPLWGADHYLNPPWDAGSIIRNILRYASRPHVSLSPTFER